MGAAARKVSGAAMSSRYGGREMLRRTVLHYSAAASSLAVFDGCPMEIPMSIAVIEYWTIGHVFWTDEAHKSQFIASMSQSRKS